MLNLELAEYVATKYGRAVLSYAYQLGRKLTGLSFLCLLLVVVLTVLSVGLGFGRDKKGLAGHSALVLRRGLLIVLAYYLGQLWYGVEASLLLNGYFRVGQYVTFRQGLIVLSGLFILKNSARYRQENTRHLLEYATILTLTVLFMLALASAANLFSAFFCVVGFSLNLYVLILFDAVHAESREAGVKYYYLSTFSSGLRIYGRFLLFATSQTGHYLKRGQLRSTQAEALNTNLSLVRFGVRLALTGVLFKLSAFPGHLWAPDVYEGSPAPITAFFRLPVKVAVIAFILSLLVVALNPVFGIWQPYLRISAAGSLVWGCFGALYEKNTKRFLAYASINQIGFLLIGLACVSSSATSATLLYLSLYVVINVGFLTVYLASRRHSGKGLLYLTDFRGLSHENWLTSWTRARRLLSRAGIPPLAGFFGKFFLLLHAQEQTLYGIVILALSTSLVSTYYYLRIIKTVWFEGTDGITRVSCSRRLSDNLFRICAECLLWFFLRFSGRTVDYIRAVTLDLAA